MQFDDFDKKIKEAAEHHHPAYDEQAWDKMDKLLDKHLPTEKDDRRRILFLLFLFLLTGAGVYLAISRPWQSKTNLSDKANVSVAKKVIEQSATPSSTDQSTSSPTKDAENKSADNSVKPDTDQSELTSTDNKTKSNKEPESDKLNSNDKTVTKTLPEVKNNSAIKHPKNLVATTKDPAALKSSVEKLNHHSTGKKFKANTNDKDAFANNTRSDKTKNITTVATPQKNTAQDNTENINQDNIIPADKPAIDNTAVNNNTNDLTIKNIDSASQKKPDAITKVEDEKKTTEVAKKDIQKPGKQKKPAFAITFTAGPDLSAVGLSSIGKVKLTYGAGLSYTLKRFTLRSGFYVSKKVYSAGPDEYHPPQHNWTYYVDLTKIDADCKVYEIPVTLSYNFSQARTHNWFVSAGLSTYLMKRETYDYYYKNPVTQQPDYKTWTYSNANKHFFSILDLSVGYERKLSKAVSMIAEPYLKIPLDGIGFGNVKLNSAGIMVTLSVKPFAGKK